MMIRKTFALMTLLLLAAATAWGASFDHDAHLQEYMPGMSCDTCHKLEAETIVPSMEVCLDCHDQALVDEASLPGTKTHGPVWALNHRSEAKGNAIDCSACHEQDYCLECHKSGFADEQGDFSNNMINVHRSDFHVSHPISARTDPQLCASCHENQFCVDCHGNFRRDDLAGASHRRTFSNLTVGATGPAHDSFNENQCQTCHPDSVLPTHEWSSDHAREARKNLATCQACHPDGDVCLKCHSARSGLMANPHPDDWGDMKNRLKDSSNGRSCRRCHNNY